MCNKIDRRDVYDKMSYSGVAISDRDDKTSYMYSGAAVHDRDDKTSLPMLNFAEAANCTINLNMK